MRRVPFWFILERLAQKPTVFLMNIHEYLIDLLTQALEADGVDMTECEENL